ncbi:pullulanase-type alpha-1,6-glucosidase [Micropruina sonneratiae]|uniref:pullulanase-type alpha-1,6-glucosidase n=1 Tax=Micropruina sonneratiae TaxID=2986940 RepID=UPI002225E52F|nr:pullulanase-type alpha-1,6-glucosidase [Micropruina sp. KQZ13P-5]MCW3156719.1 pullulanase-type alpha-1,6-glucosidase [Micropruina sp. KQZ13P-5]
MHRLQGRPDLTLAAGHWVRRDLIAWPTEGLPPGTDPAALDWRLHASADGRIEVEAREPVSWHTADLTLDPDGLPDQVLADRPHLRGYLALWIDGATASRAEELLRGQVALSAHQPSGRLVNSGSLQLPGVLDDVYADATRARLGLTWHDGVPTLRLWAPTARGVTLQLWAPDADLHDRPDTLPTTREPDGCWSVTGEESWRGARYRWAVTVFAPAGQRVVTNPVTDPYSLALTVNSTHSVVVDLDDPTLQPEQWRSTPAPPLRHAVDQVIYELHVRDFSISDKSVPEDERGSFLAFTRDSLGTRHLKRLAEAGLNTVQLLPVFDNASVEEAKERQRRPAKAELRALPPDSPHQQRLIRLTVTNSPFNWGYDPWHYQAVEGSYCSSLASAEGSARVPEFRAMIGALHALGLRVVLDQVFNHTAGHGQGAKSVLDRIVPGYYHRLSPLGFTELSTCCPNVATEHAMAQKLMVDASVLWVRQYKVDGFRFDLMGHHSRANLLAVRAALDALTPERDGVDGSAVTLYGEGWNFGEVADDARFVQARQGNLAGTGIGTFNDRLRDAVRGGGPFDADPRGQGFGTGLLTDDNEAPVNGDGYRQRDRLLVDTDLIQLGLTGNLRDFWLPANSRRNWLRGDELDYKGRPAGYASEPDEVITYVDAHDNETLFDALTMKLPRATAMADRVRMNTLCLALATLGQGPVLWHAGTDILRSKSLDRNSYNSGDWFNFLDWTMTDNGFGAGLPPEDDNGPKWGFFGPFLADHTLKPGPADIAEAHEQALDLLRLRASSTLFRLASGHAVRTKMTFPLSNTVHHVPGTLVMRVDDTIGDPTPGAVWSGLVMVVNATPLAQRLPVPGLAGHVLHPVQARGHDPVVKGTRVEGDWVRLPARTVAVLVGP